MNWTKGRQPEASGNYSIIYKGESGYKSAMSCVHYSKKHDAWNAYDHDVDEERIKSFEKNAKILAYADGNFVDELIREVLGDD